MSHVDEGALHAYLDGALDEYPPADAARIREHLEGCPVCAGRLEEEREIRAAAHGILALAAPDVEAPDLEELKAYVQRTRPPAGGASMRTVRMRWAASVVLALGTGWLLRGGLPGSGSGVVSRLESPASMPAAGESAARDVAADASGGAGRQASEQVAVAAGPDAEGAGNDRREPAAQDVAGPASTGFTANVVSAEQETPAGRLAEESVEVAAAEPAAPAVDAVLEDLVAPGAADLGAAAGGGAVTTAALEPPTEPTLPQARKVGADDRTASLPSVAPLTAVRADADSAPARTEAEADENRTRSAGALRSALDQAPAPALQARAPTEPDSVPSTGRITVPGYEVVSITSLGQGTTYQGVQAVQRLGDGSTFEIYHLEPDVDRSVVPGPADGFSEVAMLTEEGWIVLQGPLPPAELEALLQSLLPEGGGSQG
jgi:hypothetical protein